MDSLPPNVERRLTALRGAALALLFEPYGRARIVLFFHPPGQLPLTIAIDAVREARWPFAFYPSLRIPFRFAAPVRDVRIALSKSFGAPHGARQSVRVEIDLEGSAPLAFEGEGVSIGPLPPPTAANPVPPPDSTMWS